MRLLLLGLCLIFSSAYANMLPTAPAMAERIFQRAMQTHWIQQGDVKHAKHSAFIVVEPNCYYCKQLYRDIRPAIKRGDLAVRWIMTAMLQPSSEGKAAAILQASEPSSMLDEEFLKKNSQFVDIVSRESKNALAANNAFLVRFQLGTPFTIYQSVDGAYHVIPGLPAAPMLSEMIETMSNSFMA